jgi:hypothetical protein
LVTGGGIPILVNALDLQPLISAAIPASAAVRGSKRRIRRARCS